MRSDDVGIVLVGVGGQGTILASDILAELGLRLGNDVKKAEVQGMSQRGGSVVSHVRWGAEVHSPIIPRGGADVLVAFEKMEALRYADLLKRLRRRADRTPRRRLLTGGLVADGCARLFGCPSTTRGKAWLIRLRPIGQPSTFSRTA